MKDASSLITNEAIIKKMPRWATVSAVFIIIIVTGFLAAFTVVSPSLNAWLSKDIDSIKQEMEGYKGRMKKQDELIEAQQKTITLLQDTITISEVEKRQFKVDIEIMKVSYSKQIETLQGRVLTLEQEKKELQSVIEASLKSK